MPSSSAPAAHLSLTVKSVSIRLKETSRAAYSRFMIDSYTQYHVNECRVYLMRTAQMDGEREGVLPAAKAFCR